MKPINRISQYNSDKKVTAVSHLSTSIFQLWMSHNPAKAKSFLNPIDVSGKELSNQWVKRVQMLFNTFFKLKKKQNLNSI